VTAPAHLLAAAALLVPSGAAARTFADVLGRRAITRPVGEAMARSIGRSLPLVAASPGVTFTFDKATHAFERDVTVLGQLFLERATPLGRGKWNLALSWQWVAIDEVDGRELDGLRDPGPPIVDPDTGALFTVPRFGMELDTHQATLSATWGATDDLDLNLTLPLVASRFRVHAVARPAAGGVQRDRASESAFGSGDLFLRGKYRVLRHRLGEVAAGLVLRAPTGEEDDFQGAGAWQVGPALYATTPRWRVGGPLRLQGHLNAGVDLDAGDLARSEGRVGAGVDLAVGTRATFGVAILGREPFAGIAPAGFFDVARRDPRTGRRSVGPILGLERGRASLWDVAAGGRMKLWRDTVVGFANVLVPVTDDGFRAEAVPLVGVEVAF
jgi:hypothetical protein